MKLQHKFFLSYLLIISLFSTLFVGSLYLLFTDQAKKDLISSAEKTYSQTSVLLNHQLKQYLYASYIFTNSEEVNTALNAPREELIDSPGKQNSLAQNLRDAINRAVLPLTNVQMRLYIDDESKHRLI